MSATGDIDGIGRKSDEAPWRVWPRADTTDEISSIAEFQELWTVVEAIMLKAPFTETARHIFDTACRLTGAHSGYLAILTPEGAESDVLFVESDGLPCAANPNMPDQIGKLREICRTTGRAVYRNSFDRVGSDRYITGGMPTIENVLFVPLKDGSKTIGILGLANKGEHFGDSDAMLATRLAEVASFALQSSRIMGDLTESVEKLEAFNTTLVGREMRMIELKEEVNTLHANADGKPRYPEVWREELADDV